MKLVRTLTLSTFAAALLPVSVQAQDEPARDLSFLDELNLPVWSGAWFDLLAFEDDWSALVLSEDEIQDLLPSDDCLDAVIDWAIRTAEGIDWENVTLGSLPNLFETIWNDAISTLGPLCDKDDGTTADDSSPGVPLLLATTTASGRSPLTVRRGGSPDDNPRGDEAKFNAADANDDGVLSIEEFAVADGKENKPLTEVRRKFLRADADSSGGVTLAEWLAYKNDTGPDDSPKLDKFDLADLNSDGFLTLSEFAGTRSPKSNPSSVAKKFDKLDKNDDGKLTRAEFNRKPEDT